MTRNNFNAVGLDFYKRGLGNKVEYGKLIIHTFKEKYPQFVEYLYKSVSFNDDKFTAKIRYTDRDKNKEMYKNISIPRSKIRELKFR